jgi:peptidoglycan/LPS O-acetylase OafA/YrhL
MRGLAAIIVVVYHGTDRIFPMGYAAVDLFFVLSGFVLAHRHGEELSGPGHRLAYARKRVIRLYPLYAAGTLLGMMSAALLIHKVAGWNWHLYAVALVLSPLFLPTLSNVALGIFPFDGPTWSLFFEGVANAAFAFTGARPWLTALIVAVSLPLVLFSIQHWFAGGGPTLDEFPGGFARVFFSFFAGVTIYRVWKAGYRLPWSIPAALIGASMAVLYALSPSWESRYNALLVVMAQPLLIWAGASSRPGRLEPAMTWLGAISYALYIVHVPLTILVLCLIGDGWELGYYLGAPLPGSRAPVLPAILLTLPLALAAAHVLTFYVDLPVRRWLSRRWTA